ncbi:MAG: photosystem II complex extrinsic protein PsbU [Xenococcaceae cyanobacterium]
MKRWVRVLAVLILVLSSLGFVGQSQARAVDLSRPALQSSSVLAVTQRRNPADYMLDSAYGQKVDLNNASVRMFRDYRGFYPNLAAKIVNNAPYEKVEDVLEIPGLSERQKKLLQANLDNFTVSKTADVFTEGGDRYNPGFY